MTKQITIEVAEKLIPLLVKPKRIKIAVGGRGGSKSVAFADAFLKFMSDGERLCCAREYQNSIDESVHSLIESRVGHLDIPGCNVMATTVKHSSGGEIFYKGLARNVDSVKSMHGVNKVWIEEGQTISQHTIEVLFPTIREAGSEIWISMNRGSSKDPIAELILNAHEDEIERHGYYEDDDILIVEINWQDNPWFPDVLDQQRKRDKKLMLPARYAHIWDGQYSDTVENAIIQPDWFDACIDAHTKLGFKPRGAEVVSHDPADSGDDPKSIAYRHGMVFMDVQERLDLDVNSACDWATDYALRCGADEFIWDADGLGLGLRRQIDQSFYGKQVATNEFHGGASSDNPDAIYSPTDGEVKNARTNKETFFNKRAQYYWDLRDRMLRTYRAVEHGEYSNPEELISFSSDISCLRKLRAEICRIPKKDNGTGRLQILSKAEMRKPPLRLKSPNLADSVMMSLASTFDLTKATQDNTWQQPSVIVTPRKATRFERRR